MTGRNFIDSNILVYSCDTSNPSKREIAREVLRENMVAGTGVLSAQVLSEFFNVVTRRISIPLTIVAAESVLDELRGMPVIDVDYRLVRYAIDVHRTTQVNYWDGLIIAAAQRANCTRLLTEDLNPGQSYQGVLVVNPFESLETRSLQHRP